jgi:hypothetical protein
LDIVGGEGGGAGGMKNKKIQPGRNLCDRQ